MPTRKRSQPKQKQQQQQQCKPYKEEVIGRRVVIRFYDEDDKKVKPYLGTIEQLNVSLNKVTKDTIKGSLKFEHYVRFDDGDTIWFDLVEEELQRRLSWVDGSSSSDASATTNATTRTSPNKSRENPSNKKQPAKKRRRTTEAAPVAAVQTSNKGTEPSQLSEATSSKVTTNANANTDIEVAAEATTTTTGITAIKQKLLEVMRPSLDELQTRGYFVTADNTTNSHNNNGNNNGATLAPNSVSKVFRAYTRAVDEGKVDGCLYPHFQVIQKVVYWRSTVQSYGIENLRRKLRTFGKGKKKNEAMMVLDDSDELQVVKDLVFDCPKDSDSSHDDDDDDDDDKAETIITENDHDNDTDHIPRKKEVKKETISHMPSFHKEKEVPQANNNNNNAALLLTEDRLQGMHRWLTEIPHGVRNNTTGQLKSRMIVGQVRKLAAGEGISYCHWEDGVVFYKGSQVDLSYDMNELYQEAKEFQVLHGKDRSGGWVLQAPLMKLQLYKKFLSEARNMAGWGHLATRNVPAS